MSGEHLRRRGYVTAWDLGCANLLERAAALPAQPDLSQPLGKWAAVTGAAEHAKRCVLRKVTSRLGWSPDRFRAEASEIRRVGLLRQDEDDVPF